MGDNGAEFDGGYDHQDRDYGSHDHGNSNHHYDGTLDNNDYHTHHSQPSHQTQHNHHDHHHSHNDNHHNHNDHHHEYNDYPDDLDYHDHSHSQGSETNSAQETNENRNSTYMDNVVSSQPKLGLFSTDSYDGFDPDIYEKKEKYFLNSDENIETKEEDDCCDRCLLNLVECLMFLV